ncbi:MAG: hypothetical protein HN732_03455 [Rhodospirillaceae bacterium]|nr:hypothetical protein [Rhodospirillaceae bacterium]
MRWPITIVVLLLVLAVSLGLYRLESEVQLLERRLAGATTQLEENRRNSRILAAEWSFLSQPSRLQALAQRHLDLHAVTPAQIGQLAGLPRKADRRLEGGEAAAPKSEHPPLPGWKPAKPRRDERIVLAEGGRLRQ